MNDSVELFYFVIWDWASIFQVLDALSGKYWYNYFVIIWPSIDNIHVMRLLTDILFLNTQWLINLLLNVLW